MPEINVTLLLGILYGLGAAFFQASSYFFSRRFLIHCHASSSSLFAVAHFQMGVVALVALPLFLHNPLPSFSHYGLQLTLTVCFYLTGQRVLFLALKNTDSSVVAPLLGLKIPLLGLIAVVFFNESLPPLAWVSLGMGAAAAFLVSPPAGRPQIKGLLLILLACGAYSGADTFIPRLVERLQPASEHPVFLGVSLTYSVCGAVGLAAALYQKTFRIAEVQKYALPYSFCWLVGITCLFGTFSTVGVIFGNMLQAFRGLISVGLAAIILKLGIEQIERRSNRKTFLLRLAGATLMTVAIVTYYLTKLRAELP